MGAGPGGARADAVPRDRNVEERGGLGGAKTASRTRSRRAPPEYADATLCNNEPTVFGGFMNDRRRSFLKLASSVAVPAAAAVSSGIARADDGNDKDFLGAWNTIHTL